VLSRTPPNPSCDSGMRYQRFPPTRSDAEAGRGWVRTYWSAASHARRPTMGLVLARPPTPAGDASHDSQHDSLNRRCEADSEHELREKAGGC
jgi:hypothetical protein